MEKLTPHRSNPPGSSIVEVAFAVSKNQVIVDFEITCEKLHTNDSFNISGFDNEGLWNFDVAEVFIQGSGSSKHYLELQVSPLNQKFALNVLKSRKVTEKITDLSSDISSKLTSKGFSAKFIINASDIPGDISQLRAGFFACLGRPGNRSYYALNINNDSFPDYHRPELFIEIGGICLES